MVLFLTAAIVSSAAGPAGSPGNPIGEDLYVEHCATCHGMAGKASGPDRGGHPVDCNWMAMSSNATIFLLITKGGAALGLLPRMPPFGKRLSDQEVANLI